MELSHGVKRPVFFTLIVLAIWYFWSSDVWSGYFYPDKNNLSNYEFTGSFDSLEECRYVTVARGEDRGIPYSQFDYECGLNCKNKSGFNVCEKTLQ